MIIHLFAKNREHLEACNSNNLGLWVGGETRIEVSALAQMTLGYLKRLAADGYVGLQQIPREAIKRA